MLSEEAIRINTPGFFGMNVCFWYILHGFSLDPSEYLDISRIII
jgi:hypothetical protein